MFRDNFKLLNKANIIPNVLYPATDFDKFDVPCDQSALKQQLNLNADKPFFLSLNRYERKKNINLAIEAFSELLKAKSGNEERVKTVKLVIAGGYEDRINENI